MYCAYNSGLSKLFQNFPQVEQVVCPGVGVDDYIQVGSCELSDKRIAGSGH